MRIWVGVLLLAPVFAQTKRDPAAERGRVQFQSSCGFCHGNDATGNRAPDLVRSAMVSHDNGGDVLRDVIRNGRPDKGMPAFRDLNASQIADIAAFLHSRAKAALDSNSVPSDYPLAKLLTGNAAEGRSYFEGAGGCAGCHSPSGDLRGVASKYSPIELQQRFLYPSKGSKRTATVQTADGLTITGTLLHADEFEIAITDSGGWYRSWPRETVKVQIHDPLDAHRALMDRYTDRDIHNLFAYLETLK